MEHIARVAVSLVEGTIAMSIVGGELPRVAHAVPGRVRLRLAGWSEEGQQALAARLRPLAGVRHVEANPLTGAVLIRFDPAITCVQALLVDAVRAAMPPNHVDDTPPASPPRTPYTSPALPRTSGPPSPICPSCGRGAGQPQSALPTVALLSKAAGAVLGLLLADSPLGFFIGGLEVLSLLAEIVTGQGQGQGATHSRGAARARVGQAA